MKFSKALLLVFFSINSLLNQQEAKAFIIQIQQIGSDVQFSFDGSIDLTGATRYEAIPGTPMNFSVPQAFRSSGADSNRVITMGGENGTDTGLGYRWNFGTGVSIPAFGTNTDYINASDGYTVTGSGDPFAMQYDYLKLPRTYSSGDTITGQMTFANTTISGLDLTLGSVSYQLGNNTMEIYTSPSPLPILGLPVVFSYFKKLKEKSRLRGRTK